MTTPDGEALLRLADVQVWYPILEGMIRRRHVGDVRAVDGISLDLKSGETLGLVGESGCGKSTLGRAIVRLLEPTGGSITFQGRDVTHLDASALRPLRREMQMIFQDPYSSLNPRMPAGAIVQEPLDIFGIGSKRERRDRARDLLATVGLNPDVGNRFPHEFSGGQRQRIGIARALALSPQLIVADEPISALDVSIQAQILNLLQRLQQQFGLTYLFIAHDLAVVRHVSTRIAVMYLGRIVEVATSASLGSNAGHPYTVALLSAAPIPDPRIEATRRRIILKGDVPSPANPPSGCRFHPRCWLRERMGNPERCATEDPQLRPLDSGHQVACHFAEQLRGIDPFGVAVASAGVGSEPIVQPRDGERTMPPVSPVAAGGAPTDRSSPERQPVPPS